LGCATEKLPRSEEFSGSKFLRARAAAAAKKFGLPAGGGLRHWNVRGLATSTDSDSDALFRRVT
jgi:hypothetical protein